MSRIIPLRTGWEAHPGDPDAYPDDLPEDWRLAWLANLAWGVLVPPRLWLDTDPAEAAAWRADTPERFRFYLELPQTADRAGERAWADPLAAAARALGERLGGLVGTGETLARCGTCPGPRLLRVPQDTAPQAGADLARTWDRAAWEVPPALIRDLRGARAWIETRMRAPDPAAVPVPLLLGPCPIGDLERWQTLAELMGLA